MSETAPRTFEFEDDTKIVEGFAEQMFGDRLNPDGEERWKVAVNPDELGMNCGAVIVTNRQFFVLDREPTKERTTFRQIIVGMNQGTGKLEVQGISGRTHLGEDHTPFDLGEFALQCASQQYGGQVFWD